MILLKRVMFYLFRPFMARPMFFYCVSARYVCLTLFGIALVPAIAYAQATPPASGDNYEGVLKKIEESDSAVPELPPANPPAAVVTTTVTTPPAQSDLAPPQAAPPATPGQTTVTTTVTTQPADIPAVPVLPPTMPAEDLFFDAESLTPSGTGGIPARSVVRQVNPETEPASKLIIVKKGAASDTKQAQLVSAQRAVMLGRYDSALSIYDSLYTKNPGDVNVLMGRAVALQHLGQDDAAIRTYEELLELKPDHKEAQINMLGLIGQHYPAVALRRLLDLHEKDPRNVSLMAQIAVVQGKLGYADEALQYLGMAASMEPRNASHIYNMAVIADRAGHRKEAIKFYEQALETDAVYGGGNSIPRDSVFDRLAQLR